MKWVTITNQAHCMLQRHGARGGFQRNADGTVNIELDDDVLDALGKLAPETDDEIADISEAILRACSGLFGNA